jgi:hypothetical protein
VSTIETPEAANRLARAILSDIKIYNQEKLREGILKDMVFQLLAEEIEEGRKHYESRISPELRARTNFYEQAIVDVLIYQSRGIRSQIW